MKNYENIGNSMVNLPDGYNLPRFISQLSRSKFINLDCQRALIGNIKEKKSQVL
jgi:hypothetical protein